MMQEDYKLFIKSKIQGDREELWTWSGKTKKSGGVELKILTNTRLYASDAFILMNESNEIVGGYSYIFNTGNTIKVHPFTQVIEMKK